MPRWHGKTTRTLQYQILLNRIIQPARRRWRKMTWRQQRFVKFVILYLTMRQIFYYMRPDIPLILSGRPVTELPANRNYFGVNARFVLFNSWYGQFNNQLVSLMNALSIAKQIGGVLVLPCEKLGKESIRDSRDIRMRRLFSMRELVGEYFNYSLLASHAHVVRPSEFLQSADGIELMRRKQVVTERKSGGYYRYLFTGRPRGHDPREKGIKVWSPSSTRPRVSHWCDFRASKALTHVQKLWSRGDRFVLLPAVFRHHNINCTDYDPQWLSIRRWLRPNDVFLHAVERFMGSLARPVLSIHLRFFLNGDIGNFTPSSVVDMLYSMFGGQMSAAKTLFVAYTKSSPDSSQVVELLRHRFRGRVLGGDSIVEFVDPDELYRVSQLPLHAVLLDMWVCVRSDIFLGRLGSSLSWNVVYWRQVLVDDYGLSRNYVDEPMWYALENFTTTGAVRLEGRANSVQ